MSQHPSANNGTVLSPDPSNASRPPGSQRPSRWRWLVILAPVCIVVGPVLFGESPAEIARWHGAAALEKHLDGDVAGAMESLDQGLAWAPDNVELLAQKCEWQLDEGDFDESLETAERLVETHPEEPTAYLQRSSVFQHMGRHEDAVADWNKLVELADGATRVAVRALEGQRAIDVYNGRAYARAVGDLELAAGLKDAEQSIKKLGKNEAVLDTRGFIHYRLGNADAALDDLDIAVEIAADYYRQSESELRLPSQSQSEPDDSAAKPPSLDDSKDDASSEAAADKPDQDAQNDDGAASDEADESSEGEASETEEEAPSFRHRFLDRRKLEKARRQIAELEAVIRYHRSLALDLAGRADEAEADRQRVRELGFTPDPSLY